MPTAVQAKRQYLLEQILLFVFEEHHSALSAHFTSKQKLPFGIQEYSDPENPGYSRKNMLDD